MGRNLHALSLRPIEFRFRKSDLNSPITMAIPNGWAVVCGGPNRPPPIAGATSFSELADSETVVTVSTRDYPHGANRLLQEIIGPVEGWNRIEPTPTDLQFQPNVSGCAVCDTNGFEEFFVAALVMKRHEAPRSHVGVEVVAAGPPGAIVERLPLLQSMVATIGFR